MSRGVWKLRCLRCGYEDSGLVAMQEHLMEVHGVPQDSFRTHVRETVEGPVGHLRWRDADGRPTMEAISSEPPIAIEIIKHHYIEARSVG